ncbi:MAG: gluconokinase [Ardenticatenaceae bacterium]|nr:gluconokinase [Ardenticatenaceae bacterium]
MNKKPNVIILMGVIGVGKIEIGEELAEELGWVFYNGADFHPQANIDKINEGIPLTDEDRQPWLETLNKLIHKHIQQGQHAVLACSALKQSYRDTLLVGNESAVFVYLKGSPTLIGARLRQRLGQLVKANIVASQYEALEEPEGVLTIEADEPPKTIIKRILKEFSLTKPHESNSFPPETM